jgi:hypothetical protein
VPSATTASSRLTARAPGKLTGAEVITPCSLPAAMIDPENVTAPMITSSRVGTVIEAGTLAPACAVSRMYSCTATRAAAPPPTALNMLTNCGIAVICTVRAEYRPMPEPTSVPAIMTAQPVAVTVPEWMTMARVTAMAAVIPPVDTWLPRRAVAGLFIRCRPRTKHEAASTYRS